LTLVLILINSTQSSFATPFFSNGYFTENGIEWCQENRPLFEILGDKFFEHHRHSLESRVCVSLYQDYFWTYEGPDRIEKLIEKSRYYSQLEILESFEESETGIIDTTPAGIKDQTLLRGTLESGEMTIQIIASSPTVNKLMEINLSFFDEQNQLMSNVNYGITVKQKDQIILENKNIFSENGLSSLVTRPLDSEEPVVLDLIINGIGISENPTDWTKPKGEMIMFTVVPEFGTVVAVVLTLTIMLSIFLSRTNKAISFN